MPLKPFTSHFTNELGNDISLDVRTHLYMGENPYGERVPLTGVSISIDGPDNTSFSAALTNTEARQLMETLQKFFRASR